jgi:hypothetical protein
MTTVVNEQAASVFVLLCQQLRQYLYFCTSKSAHNRTLPTFCESVAAAS